MTGHRHRWPSVEDCKLERSINRALRTVPALRYRGECLFCARPQHDAHADECPALQMIVTLEKLSGTICPKEKYRLERKSA